MSSNRLQNPESYQRSTGLFLHEEITFKTVESEKIIKEMQKIKDLKTVFSFIDWIHVSQKFIESNKKAIKHVEEVQNYKLSELLGDKLQHDPKKVIHNFSSYNLSKNEISLLLKGLNFSLPPKKLKFENHLLPFELLYRDVLRDGNGLDESLIHLKSKIKDIGLSSFRFYNKKDHKFDNLSKQEYEAFLNLAGTKNIIIQKADKGNSIVIIDRHSYVSKMETLLSDTSKFVKVEFNPKHKVNKKINNFFLFVFLKISCIR